MSARKKARAAFALAVGLLLLSGLAGYLAITRLTESEIWVHHTYEVRAAITDVDWALVRAGRARSAFVISGNHDFVGQYEAAATEVPRALQRVRELTRDNPKEQDLCRRLEEITASRLAFFQKSIELKTSTPEDENGQADLMRNNLPASSEMTAIIDEMRGEEQRLLEIRDRESRRLFVVTIATLSIAFILALFLLAIHYRLLAAELDAREQAERVANESEESLRRLTARLLQLQDLERRKFSRELHDSLGQYLAGVKMNLEMFATRREEGLLAEAVQLLNQSISETRTISHLLHPPLLDEAGLSSAARWYVEGFAQRSGIEVSIVMPEDAGRLPKPVALGLFRVLQESLTNIHRHSSSTKADVALEILTDQAVLRIRDYGKGIATEVLEDLRTKGTNAGVGLAGMRERIRQLGGQLNIQSSAPGVLISVSMPLSEVADKSLASAAD